MRTRYLKPGFWKNEILAECSPLARLLFAGLWNLADRDGRLEERVKRIKADILPYDKCDVDRLLGELADGGFIIRYQVSDIKVIQIVNFIKHQRPHPNESTENLPGPELATNRDKKLLVVSPTEQETSNCALTITSSFNSNSNPSTSELGSDVVEVRKATVEAEIIDKPIMEFPVIGGGTWCLMESKYREYVETFIGLDVMGELRRALQWLRDNPKGKKTATGMPHYLGGWLSRNQNRHGGKGGARREESVGDRIARIKRDKECSSNGQGDFAQRSALPKPET